MFVFHGFWVEGQSADWPSFFLLPIDPKKGLARMDKPLMASGKDKKRESARLADEAQALAGGLSVAGQAQEVLARGKRGAGLVLAHPLPDSVFLARHGDLFEPEALAHQVEEFEPVLSGPVEAQAHLGEAVAGVRARGLQHEGLGREGGGGAQVAVGLEGGWLRGLPAEAHVQEVALGVPEGGRELAVELREGADQGHGLPVEAHLLGACRGVVDLEEHVALVGVVGESVAFLSELDLDARFLDPSLEVDEVVALGGQGVEAVAVVLVERELALRARGVGEVVDDEDLAVVVGGVVDVVGHGQEGPGAGEDGDLGQGRGHVEGGPALVALVVAQVEPDAQGEADGPLGLALG